MKKGILILIFFTYSIFGYSQNKDFVYPNFIGKDLDSIENSLEWKILLSSKGDLNKDSLDDLTLILESKDSVPEKRCSDCKLLKNKPRIILVLLNENGNQKVIIQNNKFIARGDEGGMSPYIEPELSIKNQLLTIYYQYTRSNQSYTFKFKNGKMEIINAESNDVESISGDLENNKYDFVKGELTITKGNISQEKDSTIITKINVKPKFLSEFGEMYEWKIMEYKYL